MNTCYLGYAPQDTQFPMFDVNLHMAINFKGVTGVIENFDNNGNVNRISLWKCKLIPTATDVNVKSMNGIKTPPGLRILSVY